MKKIIIYDFDGTLTPYPMPKFEILEKCGLQGGASNPKFLKMAKEKSTNENIDLSIALYETYIEIIKNAGFSLIDDNFCLGADNVIYNNNVKEFLNFLKNNHIKNYLLSSGLKVYLEKTTISDFFEKIYATTFTYNNKKEAIGVKYLISENNKVEAIKDIIKTLKIKDNDCRNIIYIGDGFTDFYAMEYVKRNGGTSIFVYNKENNSDLERLEKLNVISFKAYADYSESSELTNYIKKLCFKK